MKNVFLTICNDFAQAQVFKSYLVAQGFHPSVRDEQTRTIAPHFGQLLGKLTIEIPEDEFMAASAALEQLEEQNRLTLADEPQTNTNEETQALAKKALLNSILGCSFVPLICTGLSVYQGLQVLSREKPLTKASQKRILWSLLFNTLSFYIWLALGPKYFWPHF